MGEISLIHGSLLRATKSPSLLNHKLVSNFLAFAEGVRLEEESSDGREDLVGGLDPLVGLWLLVVCVDEGHDVGVEFRDRTMQAPLQLLPGRFREPALDLVDP